MKRRTVSFALLMGLVASSLVVNADDPPITDATQTDARTDRAVGTERCRVRIETDVCFATVDGQSLLCDIYIPEEPTPSLDDETPAESTPRPAAIVVHGGAWVSGDKWAIGVHARALAEAGIVAVSINYRHAPEFKFPAQLDDVRSALVWLNDVADKYAVDRTRVGLMGYSAGAHLSCLLGTLGDADWESVSKTTAWPQDDPRWEKLLAVKGIVAGGAPCDFTDYPPDSTILSYFLGGTRTEIPAVYEAASPVTHASSGDPPILMVHGTQDVVVPIASSRRLFEAHQRLGVQSHFIALDGPGHLWTFLHPELKRQAIRFMVERLKTK